MDIKEKWEAVISSDKKYDGLFFYGVKSTGIYCKPSCRSKKPNPENIRYFISRDEAESAGFHPCKRCRPDLLSYDPASEAAEKAKNLIDRYFTDSPALQQKLNSIGMSRKHLTRVFEERYDMSLKQYMNRIRFLQAKELLAQGKNITDVAFATGMESSASFSTFFRKQGGMSPSEYVERRIAEHPYCFCNTPVGTVRISEGEKGIMGIRFANDEAAYGASKNSGFYLADAQRQIEEYFSKKRTRFDIPLDLHGSEFQYAVWNELQTIPYGEVRTYQEIASLIGNPKAARAVGMANNRNPVLIMIPCHRVVGKNNRLVGYAGGIERKEFLLKMEAGK